MAKLEVLKHSPIKGYVFHDYKTEDGTYDYIGYAALNGAGFIQRLTKDISESRFALVDNYTTGFANRATLTYKNIFELK